MVGKLIATGHSSLDALAQLAVSGLTSPHSKRTYTSALKRFFAAGYSLTREGVQRFVSDLLATGRGAVTINVHLAAVRLLAREASIRGLLPDTELVAIERIRTQKVLGLRTGSWLDLGEVKLMLDAAGQSEHPVRNRALLALMIGCGLRRAEVCALDWSQYRRLDGRMVLADIAGKGRRTRTVPVPAWVAEYLDQWKELST
jgi:integrase